MFFKKYWFRPKRYGIGFYPASLAGWLFELLFLVFLLLSAAINDFGFFTLDIFAYVSPKEGIRFLLDVVLFASVFHILMKDRVKGGVKWRWG